MEQTYRPLAVELTLPSTWKEIVFIGMNVIVFDYRSDMCAISAFLAYQVESNPYHMSVMVKYYGCEDVGSHSAGLSAVQGPMEVCPEKLCMC